ncbi:MAG: hypothetical protein ACM30E_11605, partial [Nitrososphaerales archaeon]
MDCLKRAAVLAMAVMILVGCASSLAPVPPTAAPTEAAVTALVTPVQVNRTNNSVTSLGENQTVVVRLDDRIVVPESGHAMLQVTGGVAADVFRGSELTLADAQSQPGNALFAQLELENGHTRVALQKTSLARVRLETGFGSITTLEPGTEFVVCHDPALLTCLVVIQGEVEALAQGKVVRVKAGEGTYILKGKAPF